MHELLSMCMESVATLLYVAGVSPAVAETLLLELLNGHKHPVPRPLNPPHTDVIPSDSFGQELDGLLTDLSRIIPTLQKDTVTTSELDDAASVFVSAAVFSTKLRVARTAYNFYELAYHLKAIYDGPALDIAIRLRELSDPDNIDQFHSAIWRLAIESVKQVGEGETNWLNCLDNVELALTCHVDNPDLQADLCSRLFDQISKVRDTRIKELGIIVAVQAPPGGLEPDQREKVMKMLTQSRWGKHIDQIPPEVLEMIATIEAQVLFDDMRQLLSPTETLDPQIAWHDITFRHKRLDSAVPLGKSLIAEHSRTDLLLMDLTHEIGHAFVLQGAIGLRQTGFRSLLHLCELSITQFPEKGSNPEEFHTASIIPDIATAREAAELQLAVAIQAAIEQATWTPWLEGVSMYIELLCDPKDDPTEISGVHRCVRSLVDFNIPRQNGERTEDYARRFMDTAAAEFEDYLSLAIRKRSRLNHAGYFDDLQGKRRTASDTYCLGYLLVRSVVSAWETTLGRRLEPAIAIKLLLDATRGGTFHAFPDISSFGPDYATDCKRKFLAWLQTLANLSREVLTEFFRPIERYERGEVWIWDDLLPERAEHGSNRGEINFELKLSSLKIGITQRAANLQGDEQTKLILTAIFDQYMVWNRLLPVGKDSARLLFMNAPGRIGICIRTYTGDNPDSVEMNYGRDKNPRYHHRIWTLPGGAEAARKLRKACGEAGSARLFTTRIIDFGGVACAPEGMQNTSYVCSFLKGKYARIAAWVSDVDVAPTHPDYAALLESRVFPPFKFSEEEDTVASLHFLTKRFSESVQDSSIAMFAQSIDSADLSLNVAFEASAAAFHQGAIDNFREIYSHNMQNAACRHAMSRVTYATGFGNPPPPEPSLRGNVLSKLIFRNDAFSGITPFGASS